MQEGPGCRTCFPGLGKEGGAGLGKHQQESVDTSVKDKVEVWKKKQQLLN